MNVRHWLMLFVMALLGATMTMAQEGESTMDGVPVVEELVTDAVASDDTTTATTTSTHVSSWRITAYTDDSLMAQKTIELTEEMMDEFFEGVPGLFKGLLGLSGIGMASGAILFVVVVLFCIFGLPLILLLVLLYFLLRRRRTDEQRQTERPTDDSADSPRDRSLINKGVKNICLGIGLAIFLGIWMGNFGVGIGVLIVCVGVGEVLVDYLGKR